MNGDREVADIAEKLRAEKRWGKGCTLLIGAGCSHAGGIPLASEFIKIIEELFPETYRKAKEEEIKGLVERGAEVDEESFVPSYPNCMGQLAPALRRQIFVDYVNKAKINWAHICIASLIKAGYVDRVLTTNFDSLIVQACALLGEYPAVYDFAASQTLVPQHIPAKSIFHLHGQQTGFVQFITEEDFTEHFTLLGPLMQASRGRIWIVVGYSGQNDPVFEHIAKFNQLENDLYWVGYMDNAPPEHIKERLLNKRNANYIKGFDADSFFELLATKLGLFPPDLVSRPFSYLEKALEFLVPKEHLVRETRQKIKLAIGQFERPDSIAIITGNFVRNLPSDATQQQIFDDLQNLIAHELHNQGAQSARSERLAWAYLALGNLLSSRAAMKGNAEADILFAQAAERYKTALEHKPNYYEALNNWGVSLYNQAKTKTDEEAIQFFNQAINKFQQALEHKPDYCEALNNWGASLYAQALNIKGDEATDLIHKAIDNFEAALKIEDNLYQSYNNLGNAILYQLKFKSDIEADILFKRARVNFEKALFIKSEQLQVLNNWGMALLERHRSKQNDEKELDELGDEIVKISGQAERVKPGGGYYLSACLNALIGDEFGCRFALMKANKFNTLPSREYLLNDPNLEGVRDSEWFPVLISEVFKD
ncbi:MAG TPA: SIR2 family protein [Pyrinomonadaceae bacterium]|jgi:Tfp pilus assembly protein PilF